MCEAIDGLRAGFTHRRTVEWGDCDAAGIVFYPNYHRWMDETFHRMSLACGFDQRSLASEHGLLGTPLRQVGCEFLNPATHGDTLRIRAALESLGRRSLVVRYAFDRDGQRIASGQESRVFVRRDGERIVSSEIPVPIRAALEPLLHTDDPGLEIRHP